MYVLTQDSQRLELSRKLIQTMCGAGATDINAYQYSWDNYSCLSYQENLLRYMKPSRAIKA